MQEKHPYYKRRVLSFKYAIEGIAQGLQEEPNMKVHFFIGLLVVLTGVFFQISQIEWIAVIIAIGLVLTIEMTNTAIETVVDSFTQKEHPGAKLAKDISAGAVLIVSTTAALIGIIIFLPYLLK